MNFFVAQQIKDISDGIEELGKELDRLNEQLDASAKARDELRTQTWSQSKEIHVLQERLTLLPSIKAQNERFFDMKADIEQRLRKILGYTRALSGEFRP